MINRLRKMNKATAKEKVEEPYRIGILGAARIAPDAVIYPAGKLSNCVIHGVAARNKDKAEKFAKKHKITKVYDSYEDMVIADDIDIIFNPLPNGYHAYYTILALKAGKHVLCEKPLASNVEEIDQIIEAQANAPMNPKTNTQAMVVEAFHYRHHPLTLKIRDMILNDEIGEILDFEATLSIPGAFVPKTDIRFDAKGQNSELAGGSLMDLGCYAVSMFRFFAETTLRKDLQTFPPFEVVDASIVEAFKEPKGVDQAAKATITIFDVDDEGNQINAMTGKIKTNFKGWGVTLSYKMKGSKKEISINNPLAPHMYHNVVEIDVKTKKKTSWKEYGEGFSTYYHQLKNFLAALDGDEDALSLCKWAGGLDASRHNMSILDAIYEKAGSHPRKGKDCSNLFQ